MKCRIFGRWVAWYSSKNQVCLNSNRMQKHCGCWYWNEAWIRSHNKTPRTDIKQRTVFSVGSIWSLGLFSVFSFSLLGPHFVDFGQYISDNPSRNPYILRMYLSASTPNLKHFATFFVKQHLGDERENSWIEQLLGLKKQSNEWIKTNIDNTHKLKWVATATPMSWLRLIIRIRMRW